MNNVAIQPEQSALEGRGVLHPRAPGGDCMEADAVMIRLGRETPREHVHFVAAVGHGAGELPGPMF